MVLNFTETAFFPLDLLPKQSQKLKKKRRRKRVKEI